MGHCFLSGIGTAVPEYLITQAESIDLTNEICDNDARQSRIVRMLHKQTKIQRRYTCIPAEVAREGYVTARRDRSDEGGLATQVIASATTTAQRMQWYEEFALSLALESSRQALAEAALSPREITHLITVSCTGFYSPGIDVQLIENLPLNPSTQRVQVGFMGCHGGINGLRVAREICRNDSNANVLLCCLELCSIHYYFGQELERSVGMSLFADGSAASVLRGSNASSTRELKTTASYLVPNTTEAMSWRIGDEGFEMSLSNSVPGMIQESLKGWMTQWLAEHDLSLESIGIWAVHPGGPKILDAVEKTLGLPEEKLTHSRQILRDYGNMSSPTVFFVLKKALREESELPAVILGFGPGLMIEAALVL